jgi:hypothetical protein
MRVEDAVTFHGLQGWQPCKGGYPRRKGPLLPLREDAFAGAAKVRNPPSSTDAVSSSPEILRLRRMATECEFAHRIFFAALAVKVRSDGPHRRMIETG